MTNRSILEIPCSDDFLELSKLFNFLTFELFSSHPVFLPPSLLCRALQPAQEKLLNCKLSTDDCEHPRRADGISPARPFLQVILRARRLSRTTPGSRVTNHNLRGLLVRAIKAINADKESLKWQKEFYEKTGRPLDTLH